jgi:glutathione S-transferase
VQGVHRFVARHAGGGVTVPVLVTPEGVLGESAAIVRYADRYLEEERRLFPEDADLRAEVEELCRWLDEGLGPDGRRLMYAYMLPEKELMLRFNNQGVARWEGRMLRGLWPLATRWGRWLLDIGDETISKDTPRVWRAFDAIADRLADGRRHLFGERFTAADLTFASLAAAVLVPPEYGVRLPQPDEMPVHIAREVQAFREHPAGAYALELFRTERRS